MRVLLISANREDMNMAALPLGLAIVAAGVQSAGHDVEMVDLMRAGEPAELVSAAVKRIRPEVIGVSIRNIDDQCMARPVFLLDQAKEVVDLCRKLSPAPIVAGGAGYSIFPSAALKYINADYGVQGEGEQVFPKLLNILGEGKKPSGLPGLFVPGESPPASRPAGDPARIKWKNVVSRLTTARDDPDIWLPFQTRRGCPMRCSYCSTPRIEGTRLRKAPASMAAEAVGMAMEAGFSKLFITDNTFNLPPSYAKAFCRELINRGLRPMWRAILYPGKLDDELVELMAEAGCTDVSLGFESGSGRILARMNKRFTTRQVIMDRERMARAGIRCMGFLMLGAPGETRETVIESFDFLDRLQTEITRATIGVRIYPGTPLAEYAVKIGMISADEDLLRPSFFIEPELREWLPNAAADWAAGRKNIIAG